MSDVSRGIIHLDEVNLMRMALAKEFQESGEAKAIEVRKFPEEGMASARFYDAIEPKGFTLPLYFSNQRWMVVR